MIKRVTGNRYTHKSINPDIKYPGAQETNAMKLTSPKYKYNNNYLFIYKTFEEFTLKHKKYSLSFQSLQKFSLQQPSRCSVGQQEKNEEGWV